MSRLPRTVILVLISRWRVNDEVLFRTRRNCFESKELKATPRKKHTKQQFSTTRQKESTIQVKTNVSIPDSIKFNTRTQVCSKLAPWKTKRERKKVKKGATLSDINSLS